MLTASSCMPDSRCRHDRAPLAVWGQYKCPWCERPDTPSPLHPWRQDCHRETACCQVIVKPFIVLQQFGWCWWCPSLKIISPPLKFIPFSYCYCYTLLSLILFFLCESVVFPYLRKCHVHHRTILLQWGKHVQHLETWQQEHFNVLDLSAMMPRYRYMDIDMGL